jgi:tetratricopeptide (TPR) repeat protein
MEFSYKDRFVETAAYAKESIMGKKKKKTSEKPPTRITVDQVRPKISFWHKIIPPTILGAITTAFYYPSLKYPFQFDDLANITKKFDIRFSDPLSNWWRNRRWIGEWLNRFNFDIGRFEPYYYRLTNLAMHILTGVLVFFLILEGCSRLKKNSFFSRHAFSIAFTTSALFMLHPVQTQAVSYVIQARLEGLATLFVVATLLLILKAFQSKNLILRYVLATLAIGVGFISCGTKEIAIVSPFLAILLDWFFLAEQEWTSFRSRIWFHAIFSFVIFATFVHYLSPKFISDIAKLKMTTANNRGNVLTQHAHDSIKPLAFLISEFKVILHYLWIFVWPFGISVEYDWKLSESFFAPDSFFPFLILAVLCALAIYSLVKNRYAFFGFGLLWFFVAIAPRSTIIPSPELICDYKTYLSSIGWLFILSTCLVTTMLYIMKAIKSIPTWIHEPVPQAAIAMLLIFPLGYGTMNRNTVWSSSVAFWDDIVKKAPLKARGHNNLGVALSEENKFEEAIPHYLEAIRLDRYYSDPWSNLAVAYSVKNQLDKAISALRQAIKIFPNYPEAYNNLGTLMIRKKKYDAAEKILKMAIKIRPYYGKAFYNLGRLYIDKGEMEKAWESFKKATEGDLDTQAGFYTFGQISLKLKKFDWAAKAFEAALQRGGNAPGPQQTKMIFNLANSYYMCKQYNKAEKFFDYLLKITPNDHRALYNFGETLYSNKKYERACKMFERVVNPPFNLVQANLRYANCLEKLKRFDEAKNALQKMASCTKLPNNLRETARQEIGRISIQKKIDSGSCTLTMNDLKKVFKKK